MVLGFDGHLVVLLATLLNTWLRRAVDVWLLGLLPGSILRGVFLLDSGGSLSVGLRRSLLFGIRILLDFRSLSLLLFEEGFDCQACCF